MTEVAADELESQDPTGGDPARPRGGFGSLGSIVHLLALTWAAVIASYPLNDNSFFTHLATGRLILDRGSVPSSDPYTFTAQGEPWTVQSWLASVAYASSERLAGDIGLRLLVLTVFLLAMTLLWHLTAPAPSIFTRLLIMALALFVVSDLWSERPYMIGVIGLAVVWFALEGSVRPWMLVPLMWFWTNTHGSFPLALALCVFVILGGALDRRRAAESLRVPDVEVRAAGAVVVGVLLGAIGPLGPKLLLFPLSAITKSGVFGEIIEWRPPSYQSVAERAFLVLVVVTLLLIVHRQRWRLAIPAVVFAAMALYAQRNIVMATVVLVAVCARSAPAAGSLRSTDRPGLGRPAATVVAVLAVAVASISVLTPVDGFGGYPVRALAWLPDSGLDGVRATDMAAGNMLEVLDGATGRVFIDDRVDMFPPEVFEDYLVLKDGRADWARVLERNDVSVIVWGRDDPLSTTLAASGDWAVVFSDSQWVVACHRSSCADANDSTR